MKRLSRNTWIPLPPNTRHVRLNAAGQLEAAVGGSAGKRKPAAGRKPARRRNPGNWSSIAAIKRANQESGKYFFSPDTMRLFKTRIIGGVIGGNRFITSDVQHDGSRGFKVREVDESGGIKTVGSSYGTAAEARAAARGRSNPRRKPARRKRAAKRANPRRKPAARKAKRTVRIMGHTVTVGTKRHQILLRQKKHSDDLLKSETNPRRKRATKRRRNPARPSSTVWKRPTTWKRKTNPRKKAPPRPPVFNAWGQDEKQAKAERKRLRQEKAMRRFMKSRR